MAGTKHLRVDSKVPVLCKVVWPQRTVYLDEVAEGSLLYITKLKVHSSDWYDLDRCKVTALNELGNIVVMDLSMEWGERLPMFAVEKCSDQ